jgi:hypothetical protein
VNPLENGLRIFLKHKGGAVSRHSSCVSNVLQMLDILNPCGHNPVLPDNG